MRYHGHDLYISVKRTKSMRRTRFETFSALSQTMYKANKFTRVMPNKKNYQETNHNKICLNTI